LNYKIFKDKKEFDNYIALFEDAGKHVYGTKNSGNQYFLPMNEKAGTDIFSDRVSAAARYKTEFVWRILHVLYFTYALYYFPSAEIFQNWHF